MTAPDLTPAEARAEVEAFMGPEWASYSFYPGGRTKGHSVSARRGHLSIAGYGESFRAAVSALKQAWRDAVRPWVVRGAEQWAPTKLDVELAVESAFEEADEESARVLKEDGQ